MFWLSDLLRWFKKCSWFKVVSFVYSVIPWIDWLIDWLIFWSVFSLAVIQSLLDLISEPEPDHPLRAELAEEFTKDKKKFLKNAEDFTKKHAEKRPEWFFLELTHVIPRDSATDYFLVLFTVAFPRMFFWSYIGWLFWYHCVRRDGQKSHQSRFCYCLRSFICKFFFFFRLFSAEALPMRRFFGPSWKEL